MLAGHFAQHLLAHGLLSPTIDIAKRERSMQTRGGLILLATIGLMVLSSAANAGSIWFEPTAYLSSADMPSDFAKMNPVIEDFEDGSADPMLNIYPGKILGPGHDSGIKDVTDSVDADDGPIDGSGGQGHSFFYALNEISVEFSDPVVAAGLVFTDGPQNMTLKLEAFDTDGSSIGDIAWDTTADEVYTGTTGEDRFVGLLSNDGVSKLVISQSGGGMGIEIDHVTFAIPEPSTAGMLFIAAVILVCRRRR